MILDTLEHIKNYKNVLHFMEEITAFIERAKSENLPKGRYELKGNDLFAMIQEYETKSVADGNLEAHKQYADLQYMLEGEEVIYASAVEKLSVMEDRTPKEDILFFQEQGGDVQAKLTKDMFGIYFPHDAHQPCCYVSTPGYVKKIVFKIKIK